MTEQDTSSIPPESKPRADTSSQDHEPRTDFTSTWFIQRKGEFAKADPYVKRLVEFLSISPVSTLDKETLFARFRHFGTVFSEGKIRDDYMTRTLLRRMADRIEELETFGDKDITAGAQNKPERGSLAKTATVADSEDEEVERGMIPERREKKGRGYSNFVSNEGAQRRFYEDWFLSSPPEWFGELPEKWKQVIRTRMFINNQAAIKRKDGPFELDPVLDNRDMRIDKEALITMWEEMPGFRQAFATMWHDFFETDPTGFVKIKETAIPLLNGFSKYKDSLTGKIVSYIDASNSRDGFRNGPNGNSLTMAEAAVASAWNLIYVSNIVDSGDLERNIKGEVVAEQVRTFFRPLRKGQSKWLRDPNRGEVIGTDESWGGKLGDWFAERCRHDPDFARGVKEGTIRYIPIRLMYSWFDIQKIGSETLGAKLTNEVKRKVTISDDQKKTSVQIEGLYDFVKGAKAIDFDQLEGENLWPGYADAADSARFVYKIIQGTTKDPEMRQLATALSKLREVGRKNFSPLTEVYNDEQLIVGCILGMTGGPAPFISELLLEIPEQEYDRTVNKLLSDDRIFMSLPDPGRARKRILRILNAYDKNSFFDSWIGLHGDLLISRRGSLRLKAAKESKRILSP